jgi:hypothetical protein
MRMLKHRLKLLALAVVLTTAPASVGHSFGVASDASHEWDCPFEGQARLAAAGYEALPIATVGDPAEGSMFDSGRRALFAP